MVRVCVDCTVLPMRPFHRIACTNMVCVCACTAHTHCNKREHTQADSPHVLMCVALPVPLSPCTPSVVGFAFAFVLPSYYLCFCEPCMQGPTCVQPPFLCVCAPFCVVCVYVCVLLVLYTKASPTLAQHTTTTVVAGYTASNSDALRCSGTSCACLVCLVWLVGPVCQRALFACCFHACLRVSTPRCWCDFGWHMSWLKFCLHACSPLEQAVAATVVFLDPHVLSKVPV